MKTKDIVIGSEQDATTLFTYPNKEGSGQSLEETIVHWFGWTLKRDGLASDIECSAFTDGVVVLRLRGESEAAQEAMETYAAILPKFFAAGMNAQDSIKKIKAEGRWDPRGKHWRFFMPLGLPMAHNKALQFFHYPPQKMLGLQDYLNDPVPHRIENLLTTCGVPNRDAAQTYECIVDGAPIAAPDDEGSADHPIDPVWGNIPIQFFKAYQKEMVTALLKPHPKVQEYTIPIVVFGGHPRDIFAMQFIGQKKLHVNEVHVIEILEGLKTPVIGANHPYRFYAQSQMFRKDHPDPLTDPFRKVGNGRMNMEACPDIPEEHQKGLAEVMQEDLATTSWMLKMIEDPSQDPQALIEQELAYWSGDDETARNTVCALTRSQATLFYTDEEETLFTFVLGMDAAKVECTKHDNKTCCFCT